ncbi:PCI/PINT associated module [Penicillium macrosclerotiorum]|uniref:PCI/PINT associated module n=1 Tax=Penicillium macrosclerotiorum TaxID=303699 RepID=UPI0025488266|nr:PCI/PINT associated module [Penicillium macrosclerotiorum]KAJ5679133.1 PCI/PINT associated module [Penicillium macrosclerotiorum]
MGDLATEFRKAYANGSGDSLGAVFAPIATPNNPHRLRSFYESSNAQFLNEDLTAALFHGKSPKLPKAEQNSWVEIFTAYWEAVGEILKYESRHPGASVLAILTTWKKVANALIRGYSISKFNIPAWTLPCLYTVGKYLRTFAIKADLEAASRGSSSFGFQDDVAADVGKNENLEEAARIMNRMFTLCLSDRAPIEESRKWGIYNTTNLLFKTYFKINSVGLTKNILRAISAQSDDLPPLRAFPKSHIVTFEYYVGIIHFLDENYVEAEEHLTTAWKMCHRNALRNRELILTYLIPCHLVTTHTLPSKQLLTPFPRLENLFRPLSNCIRKGDLVGFDNAMSAGEAEFVKRRIYLPLERGRDIALRNLFRKVFITGGFEETQSGNPPIRRTRVPVAEFAAALRIGTHATNRTRVDIDEVECLLANLIYKSLMKGYIARERGMVVLSKNNTAFPGTGV